MRKAFLLFTAVCCYLLNLSAQDRVNQEPEHLSYKSKEIKKALFWQQNSKTGRWQSRNNKAIVSLGAGVAIENFHSIFVGEYEGYKYLFLDFREFRWGKLDFSWRYAPLDSAWLAVRRMAAALISEEDYNQMNSLQVGQVLTITSHFYHKMFKGNEEYSFPLFLSVGETLRSSVEQTYESIERKDGQYCAERALARKYPPMPFLVLKRVHTSDGKNVVRFTVYPHASKALIDSHYFEVDYSVYRNLFKADKKLTYH